MNRSSRNALLNCALLLTAAGGWAQVSAVHAQENAWFASNLGVFRITESTNPDHLGGILGLLRTDRDGAAGDSFGLTILLDNAPAVQQGDGLTCSDARRPDDGAALECSRTIEPQRGQSRTSGTRHAHRTTVREFLRVGLVGSQVCDDIRDRIELPALPESASAALREEYPIRLAAARANVIADSDSDSDAACRANEQCVCYELRLRNTRFGPPGSGSGSARRP